MTTKIKESPILFSAPMVLAILSGAKTQTRRIVTKSNGYFGSADSEFWKHCDFDVPTCFADNGYLHVPCHAADETMQTTVEGCEYCEDMGLDGTRHRLYPKWQVGNRLWVRETHKIWDNNKPSQDSTWEASIRCKDGTLREVTAMLEHTPSTCEMFEPDKWRPSIFMPRWASRITLEITDVRVERLNEISEEDAIAEGVNWNVSDTIRPPYTGPRAEFRSLWESINGADSWAANPWVWAISFRRLPNDT